MANREKWRASPSKCQYSGMTQSKKPMKENVENSAIGYAMESQVWKSEGRKGRGRDVGDEPTRLRRYKRAAVPYMLKMDTPL